MINESAILKQLDSLREREKMAWQMANLFVQNKDAHGVMDAGSELESLKRAISELEKLLLDI